MEETFGQNIPYIPVTIGFFILLFLSNLLQRKLRAKALIKQGQVFLDKGEIPPIEVRIAANKAWSSGQIKSEGRMFMIILWLLAITWNLCFGSAFINSFSNPEIKTGGLIALGIFSAIGIVPIVFAIRESIRHFRYGMSLCLIDEKAGVLGKTMTGKIITKSDVSATGDFTIEIQCLETYESGTSKNKTSSTRSRWQTKCTVPSPGLRSSSGIPFTFSLPKTAPETAYQLETGKISWQVMIKAPTQGVDYTATFVVPVFKME